MVEFFAFVIIALLVAFFALPALAGIGIIALAVVTAVVLPFKILADFLGNLLTPRSK